ncbi:hypothetical protein D3C79_282010 [compost metagenome]
MRAGSDGGAEEFSVLRQRRDQCAQAVMARLRICAVIGRYPAAKIRQAFSRFIIAYHQPATVVRPLATLDAIVVSADQLYLRQAADQRITASLAEQDIALLPMPRQILRPTQLRRQIRQPQILKFFAQHLPKGLGRLMRNAVHRQRYLLHVPYPTEGSAGVC